MKKKLIVLCLIFNCFFVFAEKKVYVNSKSADLMEKNTQFSKLITKVSYGAELIVIEESPEWYYVQLGGKNISGWIKATKVTNRKLSTRSSANAKEIALAGKGFSAEVENLYSNSGNGDYKAVDRVETIQTDMEKLKTFIEEGNLKGGNK